MAWYDTLYDYTLGAVGDLFRADEGEYGRDKETVADYLRTEGDIQKWREGLGDWRQDMGDWRGNLQDLQARGPINVGEAAMLGDMRTMIREGDPYYRREADRQADMARQQALSAARSGSTRTAALRGMTGQQQATAGALGARYNVGQQEAAQRSGMMGQVAGMEQQRLGQEANLAMQRLAQQYQGMGIGLQGMGMGLRGRELDLGAIGQRQSLYDKSRHDELQRAIAKLGQKPVGAAIAGGVSGMMSSDRKLKKNIRPGSALADRDLDAMRSPMKADMTDRAARLLQDRDALRRSFAAGGVSDVDKDRFMDSLRPEEFEYRSPERGLEGRHLGIMANDLEKTRMGRGAVFEGPAGKMIDNRMLTSRIAAGMGRLNERLRELEAEKKGGK